MPAIHVSRSLPRAAAAPPPNRAPDGRRPGRARGPPVAPRRTTGERLRREEGGEADGASPVRRHRRERASLPALAERGRPLRVAIGAAQRRSKRLAARPVDDRTRPTASRPASPRPQEANGSCGLTDRRPRSPPTPHRHLPSPRQRHGPWGLPTTVSARCDRDPPCRRVRPYGAGAPPGPPPPFLAGSWATQTPLSVLEARDGAAVVRSPTSASEAGGSPISAHTWRPIRRNHPTVQRRLTTQPATQVPGDAGSSSPCHCSDDSRRGSHPRPI
jgi:hypothetical protein